MKCGMDLMNKEREDLLKHIESVKNLSREEHIREQCKTLLNIEKKISKDCFELFNHSITSLFNEKIIKVEQDLINIFGMIQSVQKKYLKYLEDQNEKRFNETLELTKGLDRDLLITKDMH
jgi:flagellin-specific chaperone FliS